MMTDRNPKTTYFRPRTYISFYSVPRLDTQTLVYHNEVNGMIARICLRRFCLEDHWEEVNRTCSKG